jgi:pimeloyl-ACP methyl ester carboxylesterase
LLCCLYTFASAGHAGELVLYEHHYYEYSGLGENTPLIICAPGFTQHHHSAEFHLLKGHLMRKGYSVLVMNPPQHGDDYSYCPKPFSWGANEPADLCRFMFDDSALSHIGIKENILTYHSDVHLLGFSIGAKIVVHLGAMDAVRDRIASIVAVATPYRVEEINMRLSGDACKIAEGTISGLYAYDRSSICRLAFMAVQLFGRCFAQRPENRVDRLSAPLLLIHGKDDWLTKSYHSVKLFRKVRQDQQAALCLLNTRTHAEDMLTRDRYDLRVLFMDVLDTWFEFTRKASETLPRDRFDTQFAQRLDSLESANERISPKDCISLMSTPVTNDLNSNLWVTPADMDRSYLTWNTNILDHDGELNSRHYLSFGCTDFSAPVWQRFRAGFSFSGDSMSGLTVDDIYLNFYADFGSLLRLRRLSLIASDHRQLISSDLGISLIDLQLNYYAIRNGNNATQLRLNLPLVGEAAASYIFGFEMSTFVKTVPSGLAKNGVGCYLFLGLPESGARFTPGVLLQYQQDAFQLNGVERNFAAGLSFRFK